MAVYFVDGARADDTGSGLTWALAKKTIQAALTAASGGTDIVVIKYDGLSTTDSEVGADTTYTTTNSVAIISASADDTGTAYTPTPMWTGTGDPAYWIGNSTTNYFVRFDGGADDRVFVYGLCLRVSGSTADNIELGRTNAGADMTWENCYFWLANTATTSIINVGYGNAAQNYHEFNSCQFRFGNASQYLQVAGISEFNNCAFAAQGTVPTGGLLRHGGGYAIRSAFHGCDFSQLGSNALITNVGTSIEFTFERCKFGTSFSVLATQTSNPTRSSAHAWVFDCYSDDTHLFFGYYNALGSVINDTGIYFTTTDAEYVNSSNAEAPVSWKIVTSANASFYMPFETPYIDLYHTGTSQITPYFEIVRSGSATAYQNDEIWAEFTAKVTASSTQSSAIYSDRKDIDSGTAAADQTAGAGTGSWTGESATSWSGKIDSGTAITPAEKGYIRGRICVGEPSITVYVDPQIRT